MEGSARLNSQLNIIREANQRGTNSVIRLSQLDGGDEPRAMRMYVRNAIDIQEGTNKIKVNKGPNASLKARKCDRVFTHGLR